MSVFLTGSSVEQGSKFCVTSGMCCPNTSGEEKFCSTLDAGAEIYLF